MSPTGSGPPYRDRDAPDRHTCRPTMRAGDGDGNGSARPDIRSLGSIDAGFQMRVDRALTTPSGPGDVEREVRIEPAGTGTRLAGILGRPPSDRSACGLVLFAHGSGSSRHSPRNRLVAEILQRAGFATLLMDLLTREEDAIDRATARLRFDVALLAERLTAATRWCREQPELHALRIGYFGASTGAAAALLAAAELGAEQARAIVSRGGRPDLAGEALRRVATPTLLIVGGADAPVIALNRQAATELRAEHELLIIPGATHLFEEPGALEQVGEAAARWFRQRLT